MVSICIEQCVSGIWAFDGISLSAVHSSVGMGFYRLPYEWILILTPRTSAPGILIDLF